MLDIAASRELPSSSQSQSGVPKADLSSVPDESGADILVSYRHPFSERSAQSDSKRPAPDLLTEFPRPGASCTASALALPVPHRPILKPGHGQHGGLVGVAGGQILIDVDAMS